MGAAFNGADPSRGRLWEKKRKKDRRKGGPFCGIGLLSGLGGFTAGAEGLEVQLLDLGGDRLGHDLLPVDRGAAQGVAHGTEKHHVHALGIAQLNGDIAGGDGDGFKVLLHGLDAAGGIRLGTGGDGGGLDA